MLVTRETLQGLRTGFSALYQAGLSQVESQYAAIATVVPSTTSENTYGWLGSLPNMREWIGPRQLQALMEHEYTVKNKDFELTVRVQRNHIKDDNLGIYNPLFTEMGRATGAHPDQQCFGALAGGFDQRCYDGQYFFDTDHPVIADDGSIITVSNTGGGTGPAWFLMDDSRAIKPVIYQDREAPQFVAVDNVNDPSVFHNKEFLYGVDGRNNTGYGFWQMAYGSQQPLTPENYEAARVAIGTMTGDHGRKLGLRGKLLVVPQQLEGAAIELLNSERQANGATNKWKGTAKLMLADWL
ncbi:Mu-like prophage major head subunit gpT family protein [Roseobacter sp. YSTF-M11]|uniref:Mu-like prophage major head subunit gpT family protein n=1 Tax=Roseobacter insulae TaxID=2859783 RepID=A0A9X1FW12_9RHOB|nr:Mu-like prophage major head subunit gpT family protein [Roseobacter insulae]MBW4708626.1 Mu-like prophage major head subunit gpT family protein [Roseobacter insulae]